MEFYRTVKVEFIKNEHKFGVLYDIGSNKEHKFLNKFVFDYVYEFLAGRTTRVSGTAFQEHDDEVDQNEKRKIDRPVGVKEAKRRKEKKKRHRARTNEGMNKSQYRAVA